MLPHYSWSADVLLWLGYLNWRDPLYGWLKHDVFPQLGLPICNSAVEVYLLKGSNKVYLYKTFQNGVGAVGKFYGGGLDSKNKRLTLMREYWNIQRLKDLGFYKGHYQVVHCLGYNEYINYVLMTKYVEGRRLDHYIRESAFKNRNSGLYNALSELAYFLYLLHSRSVNLNVKFDFKQEYAYFHKTLSRLKDGRLISHKDADNLHKLKHRWKHKPEMWSVQSVQIHGDCTPTNFIFDDNPKLVVLDLERSRTSDPAFDTGRVAGELKHHFIMFTGDGWKAEPFINHFYKEYCSHSESPTSLFNEITERNPFYQAVTELRIAKNPWVSPKHRRRLIDEAKKCLKY